MLRKLTTIAATALLAACSTREGNDKVNIGKQTIQMESDVMTPEALWAMSRIAGYQAAPDGEHVAFQMGYYSVKENRSHQVLWMMNADGSGQKQLTEDAENETDVQWLDAETIAFLRGGEVWKMHLDGTGRTQMSQTEGKVEGFLFSPDGQKAILLKSIDFNKIIQKTPDDLPQATGRVVNDLMYRHWDHYVETIQHPFVGSISGDGIATDLTDILEGEPFECPMEPFGGIEQLAWSPDSKFIAFTCRCKTGIGYSISTDSDIFLYDTETRQTTNLCKPADYKEPAIEPTKTMKDQPVNRQAGDMNVGYDTNPKFSPDGRCVAWLSMERDGYESDRQRLCIRNLQEAFIEQMDPPKKITKRDHNEQRHGGIHGKYQIIHIYSFTAAGQINTGKVHSCQYVGETCRAYKTCIKKKYNLI